MRTLGALLLVKEPVHVTLCSKYEGQRASLEMRRNTAEWVRPSESAEGPIQLRGRKLVGDVKRAVPRHYGRLVGIIVPCNKGNAGASTNHLRLQMDGQFLEPLRIRFVWSER